MKTLAIFCTISLIGVGAASAQPRFAVETGFRVPLGCQIRNEKVIVITNTSGAALSATTISYDAIRKPDMQHYGKSAKVTFLAAGGVLQVGGVPSFSCTAWFRRTPMLAPN